MTTSVIDGSAANSSNTNGENGEAHLNDNAIDHQRNGRVHILLIEGNELLQRMLCAWSQDYQWVLTKSDEAASLEAHRNRFSIIILGSCILKGEGSVTSQRNTLVSTLRQSPLNVHTPIIAMAPDAEHKCINIDVDGIDDRLDAGCTRSDFVHKIDAWAGKSSNVVEVSDSDNSSDDEGNKQQQQHDNGFNKGDKVVGNSSSESTGSSHNTLGGNGAKPASQDTPTLFDNHDVDAEHPLLCLVAEDNYVTRQVITMFLQRLKVQSFAAQNGHDAIAMCRDQIYDLIFMDMSMPGMNGIDAVKNIRSMSSMNRYTPIIAFSSYGKLETFTKIGLNDFLKKPFNKEDLEKIVRKWAPEPKKRRPVPCNNNDATVSSSLDANGDSNSCGNSIAGSGSVGSGSSSHAKRPYDTESVEEITSSDARKRLRHVSPKSVNSSGDNAAQPPSNSLNATRDIPPKAPSPRGSSSSGGANSGKIGTMIHGHPVGVENGDPMWRPPFPYPGAPPMAMGHQQRPYWPPPPPPPPPNNYMMPLMHPGFPGAPPLSEERAQHHQAMMSQRYPVYPIQHQTQYRQWQPMPQRHDVQDHPYNHTMNVNTHSPAPTAASVPTRTKGMRRRKGGANGGGSPVMVSENMSAASPVQSTQVHASTRKSKVAPTIKFVNDNNESSPMGSESGDASARRSASRSLAARLVVHNERERERRKEISDAVQDFREIVPGCCERMDKVTVLRQAVAYMRQLLDQHHGCTRVVMGTNEGINNEYYNDEADGADNDIMTINGGDESGEEDEYESN